MNTKPTQLHYWNVFVISLADAHAHARQLDIARQLESLSIPFEFIDAIDGRAGLAAEYEQMIDRAGTEIQLGRHMTDPEYACALSHMSIYRRIVDENLPGAIVLEDDAILGPLFKEFLDARGYEVGALIQLDHLNGDIWRFTRPIRLTAHIRLAKAARNTSLSSGYSISRSAASHLLDHGLPLRGLADWPCDVTKLPADLVLPRVIYQADLAGQDSAIETGRAAIVSALPRKSRSLRFFKVPYWRRWWFKRMTKRVS